MAIWYFYVDGKIMSTRLSQQAADDEQRRLERHWPGKVSWCVQIVEE